MELLDHGSRHPISYGQHKLFDTEVMSLGVCVRSNTLHTWRMWTMLRARLSWRMWRKPQNWGSFEQTGKIWLLSHFTEQNWSAEVTERSSSPRLAGSSWWTNCMQRICLIRGCTNLDRNKFFWSGMALSLEKKYLSCEECKTNSISHHKKTLQVVP